MTIEEAKKGFNELKAQGMSDEEIVAVLYLMFQNDEIDVEELGELVKVLGYELSDEFLAMSPEDQKTKGWEETPDADADSEGSEERAKKGDDEEGPKGTEEAKEYDKDNPAPVFDGKEGAPSKTEEEEPKDSKECEDDDDEECEKEDSKDFDSEEDDDTKARRLFGFGDKK